jgi:hypothetical protein
MCIYLYVYFYPCMYVCLSVCIFVYESSLLSGLSGELNKKEGTYMYDMCIVLFMYRYASICMNVCIYLYVNVHLY